MWRSPSNFWTCFLFLMLMPPSYHGLLAPYIATQRDSVSALHAAATNSASSSNHKIVWFRPHALRTDDNEAWRQSILLASNSSSIRCVFLWDRPLPSKCNGGGSASDVFLVHALDALNQTSLGGSLDVVAMDLKADGIDEQDKRGFYCECMTEALGNYATLVSQGGDFSDNRMDGTKTELLYVETFDRDLESSLKQHLLQRNQHVLRINSFGNGHDTLLDYSERDVVQLVRDAIQKHPFASPLIPFVDYVVSTLQGYDQQQLEDNEECTNDPLNNDYDARKELGRPSSPLVFLSIQDDLLKFAGKTENTDWGTRIAKRWPATEEAATVALNDFVQSQYSALLEHDGRTVGSDSDTPSSPNKNSNNKRPNHLASNLSPYLARGLLSPKQVYRALQANKSSTVTRTTSKEFESGSNSFLRRLAWRDYAYAASLAFPKVVLEQQPIRSGYEECDNIIDETRTEQTNLLLQRWKDGSTGFPLVDAGMRQLAQEGFMPQQVRLATSACLVEGLNVPWELGRAHFENFLVDYDVVINTHMWMNAGGVGLDPYYIGLDYKKRPYWDATGDYVREWCPELQALPDRLEVPPTVEGTGGTNIVDALFTPWKAPADILQKAGVVLGDIYPHRIADERNSRRSFLQRLRQCRSSWPRSEIDSSGNDMINLGGVPIGAFTPRALKF